MTERMTCGDCPNWRPEPVWKQLLFFWRTGLAMGRCDCAPGELLWWPLDCPRATRPVCDATGEGR